MNASHYEILLAIGILAPFVCFWILVFWGPRLGKPAAGWLTVVLAMGVPLILATYVLIGWRGEVSAGTAAELTANACRIQWATIGTVPVTIGVKLDSLTVIMYFMVTFIAFWIFYFSVGYMAGHSDEVDGQSKYQRFFAYLSLFGFSMLGLVVSSSLLFLFIFWELVGLCSYLLIGFYFDKAFASAAAVKAFVTNRVGDFGFLIGLMLVFLQLGTLDLDQAAAVFREQYATQTGIFAGSFTLFGWSLATIMGIGLFCGAMGKSAQFPLHVWLPDAMAGPTPVSALIHAATMVAAGVYLVARVFRLMTPDALMFIAVIGCLTLTLMALIAIVQTDIKKCLAYSTLSQLGYMIFGMGCGAWVAALFHLMTHAFFKAMLFLCSGQVIEGCHHEQDMRRMGGLRKKMPVTCWTFFVGVLAISGAGIAGVKIAGIPIGLGGFFSKDEILAVAYVRAFEWDDFRKHQHEGNGHLDGHEKVASAPRGGRRPPLTFRPSTAATGGGRYMGNAHSQHPAAPTGRGAYNTGSVLGELNALPSRDREGAVNVVDTGPLPYGRGSERASLARSARSLVLASDEVASSRSEGEQHAGHGASREGHASHTDKGVIFTATDPLPPWMFYLAIFTAYVTPFYMMRCWWMTFMGKPRDEQVHEHAHESPLMYVPLVVLAVGTLVSSYFLFRPLIADAAGSATDAALVMATDGDLHTEAIASAHHWLQFGVGGAFIVGFAVAVAIYFRGLRTATAIKRAAGPLAILLEHKYYFDEVYDLIWVKGCILVARIARFLDTWLVDLIFDTLAAATERLAAFSGLILDNQGVDGVVNGIAGSSMDFAGVVRGPQTGRIRNYVLFAMFVATVVVGGLMWFSVGSAPDAVVAADASLVP